MDQLLVSHNMQYFVLGLILYMYPCACLTEVVGNSLNLIANTKLKEEGMILYDFVSIQLCDTMTP